MTANRKAPTTTTDPGDIAGDEYASQVNEEIEALWDQVVSPVGGIGGIGNSITGTPFPPLTEAPADGQRFSLIIAAPNTTSVVLNLGQGGALALNDIFGDALESGDLQLGELITVQKVDADNGYRLTHKTDAQIERQILAQTGSDTAFVFIDSFTIGVDSPATSEALVEMLFTASAYQQIIVIVEGLSADANASNALEVTLRHAGGAIVTNTLTSSLVKTNDRGVFTATYTLDNITNTGSSPGDSPQYYGELAGAAANLIKSTNSASGGSTTPPDRIRVRLTVTRMDAGRVTLLGRPVPA